MTPGRIFLGVGSGEALNEKAATSSWPKWPERSERLVEATDIIRKLWGGKPVNHVGKYYRTNMRLYDAPQSPIHLFMAGNGPKAMNRVGRYADGLITDQKTWKEHRSEFESGAKVAGKDPKDMPVWIEQYVVVGDRKTRRKAPGFGALVRRLGNHISMCGILRKSNGEPTLKYRWRNSTKNGPLAPTPTYT